jgi:N-acyl-D-amino-acid deacylase
MRRVLVLVAGLATLAAACQSGPKPMGTLIANVTLYDGGDGEGRVTSVRILGDRIDSVGNLRPEPDEWFIDGAGMALAPGFIDTHSHADDQIFEYRDALAAVSQGITTVVVGQDGGSPFPLADFYHRLDSTPAAINVASYSGHATLRLAVMGKDDYRRPATRAEMDSIKSLLYRDMDAGALGLSTGLEYDEGHSASYEEVLALAQAAGAEGGRYISHIRSEDRGFWEAIDEIIRIGKEAAIPVQISHLKLAQRRLWGQADSLIGVLDRARADGVQITADIYPYTYWQSTLRVLFPERNYTDRAAADFALTEVSSPEGLLISRWAPDSSYVGKTIAEIAKLRRTDPATTLIRMIQEADSAEKDAASDVEGVVGAEGVIGTSMDEVDVQRLMQWPFANICTDGALAGRHPRGYGAFTKVLGPSVRDARLFTLEEAVRKMTSLAARNLGLRDRGVIRKGAYADLVLFDPATVADQATTTDPQLPSLGVTMVWVNGEVVFEQGRGTGKYPGRVIRRGDVAPK